MCMGSTYGYFVKRVGWERASGATLVALVGYGRSKVGKRVVAHVEKGTLFNQQQEQVSSKCLLDECYTSTEACKCSLPSTCYLA